MKKLLSILAAVGMTATAGIAVVACSNKGGTQDDTKLSLKMDTSKITIDNFGSVSREIKNYDEVKNLKLESSLSNTQDSTTKFTIEINKETKSLVVTVKDNEPIQISLSGTITLTSDNFEKTVINVELLKHTVGNDVKISGITNGESIKVSEGFTRTNEIISKDVKIIDSDGLSTTESTDTSFIEIKTIDGHDYLGINLTKDAKDTYNIVLGGDNFNDFKFTINFIPTPVITDINDIIVYKDLGGFKELTEVTPQANNMIESYGLTGKVTLSDPSDGFLHVKANDSTLTGELDLTYTINGTAPSINEIQIADVHVNDKMDVIKESIKQQIQTILSDAVEGTDYIIIGDTSTIGQITVLAQGDRITGGFVIKVLENATTDQEKFIEQMNQLSTQGKLHFELKVKDGEEDQVNGVTFANAITGQLRTILKENNMPIGFNNLSVVGSEMPPKDIIENGGTWTSSPNQTIGFQLKENESFFNVECNYSFTITKWTDKTPLNPSKVNLGMVTSDITIQGYGQVTRKIENYDLVDNFKVESSLTNIQWETNYSIHLDKATKSLVVDAPKIEVPMNGIITLTGDNIDTVEINVTFISERPNKNIIYDLKNISMDAINLDEVSKDEIYTLINNEIKSESGYDTNQIEDYHVNITDNGIFVYALGESKKLTGAFEIDVYRNSGLIKYNLNNIKGMTVDKGTSRDDVDKLVQNEIDNHIKGTSMEQDYRVDGVADGSTPVITVNVKSSSTLLVQDTHFEIKVITRNIDVAIDPLVYNEKGGTDIRSIGNFNELKNLQVNVDPHDSAIKKYLNTQIISQYNSDTKLYITADKGDDIGFTESHSATITLSADNAESVSFELIIEPIKKIDINVNKSTTSIELDAVDHIEINNWTMLDNLKITNISGEEFTKITPMLDNNGELKTLELIGLKEGTTTVTLKADNSKELILTINVQKKAIKIDGITNGETINLNKGQTSHYVKTLSKESILIKNSGELSQEVNASHSFITIMKDNTLLIYISPNDKHSEYKIVLSAPNSNDLTFTIHIN